MKKIIGDLGAALQFMQKGLRSIDKNASLFPSSPFLVDAMVAAVPLAHAKCVIEFGPGTGVVTEKILKALPDGAHLHAIELDEALLNTTTTRLRDDRLIPHHGSAAEAAAMVQAHGCKRGSSAVFSSLGLALMNDELRDSILAAARNVLAADGAFVQYQYLHGRAITYQFGQGWSRFDGKAYLRRHFQHVKSKVVLPNVPPAAVYSCQGPLRKAHPATPRKDHARARRRPAATRRRGR